MVRWNVETKPELETGQSVGVIKSNLEGIGMDHEHSQHSHSDALPSLVALHVSLL